MITSYNLFLLENDSPTELLVYTIPTATDGASADPFWADTFQQLFVHSKDEGRDDLLFLVKWDTLQVMYTVEKCM